MPELEEEAVGQQSSNIPGTGYLVVKKLSICVSLWDPVGCGLVNRLLIVGGCSIATVRLLHTSDR